MEESKTPGVTERKTAKTGPMGSERQWHRLYYVLVVFDIFTVSLSLYVNHHFMRIFIRSVEVNEAWVDRLHQTAKLGQLAAEVNAPGNDVFQSRQVEAEAERMRAARSTWSSHLQAVREELLANVPSPRATPLAGRLQDAQQAMDAMNIQADLLFTQLRKGLVAEAGTSMAAMDRQYALVNRALEELRRDIGAVQKEHFDRQTGAAVSLQRSQYVLATLILLMIAGAAIYGYKLRIITERNQAAHLRRQLLQKVIAAQEDERRRISRDLHDEIGQALTSLLVGLRAVSDASSLELAREQSDSLRNIAVAALEEVRRLARGLRPSVLDDIGLLAAAERYAADFTHASGIPVHVEAQNLDARPLPDEIATALYRILQEALTNTSRHAVANNVHICLQRQPGVVAMIIRDDGRGFDHGKAGSEGLGLSGMRERAALLDGTVNVVSRPGDGTTISVRIPLEREAEHGEDSRVARG